MTILADEPRALDARLPRGLREKKNPAGPVALSSTSKPTAPGLRPLQSLWRLRPTALRALRDPQCRPDRPGPQGARETISRTLREKRFQSPASTTMPSSSLATRAPGRNVTPPKVTGTSTSPPPFLLLGFGCVRERLDPEREPAQLGAVTDAAVHDQPCPPVRERGARDVVADERHARASRRRRRSARDPRPARRLAA